MKKSLLEFSNNYLGEKVVLFGASSGGKKFLNEFDFPNILCFCDSDEQKWNLSFCGYNVISPDSLMDIKEPVHIIITSDFVKEIYSKLVNIGFRGGINSLRELESRRKCSLNEENIGKVYSLLNDDESKITLNSVIDKRKNFTTQYDYSDVNTSESMYFNNLLHCSEDEVYIDGGAAGNSSFDFMAWSNYKFKRIYCFEPTTNSINILSQKYEQLNLEKEKYKLLNLGLYSENTTLKFESCSTTPFSNRIIKDYRNNNNIVSIDVVKLDDIIDERVTFIKMDIEGSELEAIRGAKNIIKTYKPKLAVCLYHNIDDLWEIPIEVKKICPEYKIYIRHHSSILLDTVLYATI